MRTDKIKLSLLAAAILLGGCEKRTMGGGTPPPPPPPTTAADCVSATELEWSGDDICSQQLDSTHYSQPAVQIYRKECPGIHVKHRNDMILYLEVHKENSTQSCPANPFAKHFPFDSGPNHIKDFKTGKVTNSAAIGCEYELKIKDKQTGEKCDPHIAIMDY